MPGRAQGVDGHGAAERGRERVEIGKGGYPGVDGPPPSQPETSTPAGAAPGAIVRRQVPGWIHAVRPGSHPLHHHPHGDHRPGCGEEAVATPGGLCEAARLRFPEYLPAVPAPEHVAAGVTQVGGQGAAAFDVEALVKREDFV